MNLRCILREAWLPAGGAAILTIGLLYGLDIVPGMQSWYAGSEPYLNMQASALRAGRLAISEHPAALDFDLAWSRGGVQQLWGLGVPAWLVFLSVLSGGQDPVFFPARAAFSVAVFLLSFAVLSVLGRKCRQGLDEGDAWGWRFWILIIPAGAVILCYPPFCGLLKSCFRVYEEVAAYSYLFAILTGLLLFRAAEHPTLPRILTVYVAAGFAAFVRPTCGIYGAAAALIVTCIGLRARKGLCFMLPCAAVYPLLVAALLWSNNARFGSPLEFGHSLSVGYHPDMLLATHFGMPFKGASVGEALRELFGALLFDARFNYGDWLRNDVFALQSETLRWRENYLPALGWPLVVLAASGTLACFVLCRFRNFCERHLVFPIALYCTLATGGLIIFYLRCPVLSSRYLYDFAPAFAIVTALAWTSVGSLIMQCRPQYGRLLLVPGALLCLYLCARVQAMQTGEEDNVSVDGPTYRRNVTGRNCSKVAVRMPSETGAIRVLNEKRVGISSIPFDGAGWAASSGEVEIVSTHFCADLEMVELEIVRVGLHQNADPFDIRVKVGLEMLERQSLVNEETSVKIRFGAPKRAEYQRGLQPVFIAWGSAESLVRSTHPWRLMQLKWKKGSQPFNWQGKY